MKLSTIVDFKIYFYYCICVCSMNVGDPRGQKRMADPLVDRVTDGHVPPS